MRRWLLGLAGCLGVTCAQRGPELAHAESPRAALAPALAPSVASKQPLQSFFGALKQLSSGARQSHVHVLWLGDSHTAADYLSGAVRGSLSERFGDGGPGFVRIGTKPYRHDGLKIARDGKWNVDPDPPPRRALQDDGVFGLGGTRAAPAAGASFSVGVTSRALATEPARFELAYSLPPGASFDVSLGDKRTTVSAQSPSELAPSGISHLVFNAPLGSQLTLLPRSGAPRLFELIVERSTPGVVLDTVGIDGARLETPLAWKEEAFVAEVARRLPELFVIAYGTNEAFDALKVEKYGPQLSELVRRLRRGAPTASCLVLGPTDAPLGDGSVPRVAEVGQVLGKTALSLGCSFVSLQQLMGGEGSFARGMKAKERLCQADKLHLTPKGYQEVGRALGKLLLDGYSVGRGDVAALPAAAAGGAFVQAE